MQPTARTRSAPTPALTTADTNREGFAESPRGEGVGDEDSPRERWNRRYRQRGLRAFAQPPGAWLVESGALLAGVRGHRALDVACGDGRNAAFLARLGFVVDAVDISDVAIDALQIAAAQRRLPVNALRLDLQRDPLPDGRYDVIVQLNYLQRGLFATLIDALAPGGLLIAETVTRAHVEQLGNRFDPRFVLEPGELRRVFAGHEIVRYQELVAKRNGRPRAVASLIARRA
jgi:tellurite methyltransferase